jgi:hypothetical protein
MEVIYCGLKMSENYREASSDAFGLADLIQIPLLKTVGLPNFFCSSRCRLGLKDGLGFAGKTSIFVARFTRRGLFWVMPLSEQAAFGCPAMKSPKARFWTYSLRYGSSHAVRCGASQQPYIKG